MLDYYYQLLEVPKGTTGEALMQGYQRKKQKCKMANKSEQEIALVDKAFEILKNVTVSKEKVVSKDGKVSYEFKFHPNPEFYRTFYDKINSIKAEKRRIREKEYTGPMIWLLRFFTFFWLVVGIVMVIGPLHWAYYYDNWQFLIFFSPLFYGTYYMYFKVMNWKKFRFERNGDWI